MVAVPLGFLSNIGLPELVIILLIVLLLFGHRLPGVGRALGRSVSEFKSGLKEDASGEKKEGAEPQKEKSA
jgi:sec-independent protein translocase protein TatA